MWHCVSCFKVVVSVVRITGEEAPDPELAIDASVKRLDNVRRPADSGHEISLQR
jgi:hypothetical protein